MPKKKLVEDEEVYEWDKKRIIIAFAIIIVLIAGAFFAKKYFLADQASNPASTNSSVSQDVQGANTQSTGSNATTNFSLPSANDLQNQLNALEQKIQHLSVQDVASASPQVQDIIQQAQNLPNLPKDQAKSICQTVCGSYMK